MKAPRILQSPLTKKIYIVTSYEELGGGAFRAKEKYDVTDEIQAIFKNIKKHKQKHKLYK